MEFFVYRYYFPFVCQKIYIESEDVNYIRYKEQERVISLPVPAKLINIKIYTELR